MVRSPCLNSVCHELFFLSFDIPCFLIGMDPELTCIIFHYKTFLISEFEDGTAFDCWIYSVAYKILLIWVLRVYCSPIDLMIMLMR
jgi:hypothetical protein